AHVHRREQRVADRQHRGAELVLSEPHVVAQIAELGERVGQARHRRLGQPGAHRDLLVAEQRLERREAAQDFEAARERGGELAVAFVLVAESRGRLGKRYRGFWGAHGEKLSSLCFCSWGCWFRGCSGTSYRFRYSVAGPPVVNLVI